MKGQLSHFHPRRIGLHSWRMDPSTKLEELHERTIRLFNTLIRLRALGWPTASMTEIFLDAERAENACRIEIERCVGDT
jgi:hypothetical protein